MKKYLLIITALASVGTLAYSQNSLESVGKRSIEMRPAEKRYLTLKPTERNPYSARPKITEEDRDEEQNAEETAIMQKLSSLNVSGSSRSYNGLRLLLGDILIERGRVLPQLIRNQTQQLKVTEVTPEKIVLGWMDVESGELTGKTIPIPYDVDPVVRYVLQGQGGGGDDASTLEMGVLRPNRPERR